MHAPTRRLLSLLLCAVLMTGAVMMPVSADTVEITDAAHSEVYRVSDADELPDPDEAIADADAYSIIVDSEVVLTVEQKDTPAVTGTSDSTDYSYAVDFTIPMTNKQVYIAGLTADNVATVQQAVVNSYTGSANFDITALDFIDCEKDSINGSGDDDLCWAAAAANLLYYSGWAAQAGFSDADADDLFELYIDNFTDDGSDSLYAVGWFFNGIDPNALMYGTGAALRDSSSGGYLTDYAYDRVTHEASISDDFSIGLPLAFADLRAGYAVNLNITVQQYGGTNGHAQTLWGYVINNAYPETDARHYEMVFLTDSDSDKYYTERRDAPNILNGYALLESSGALYYSFGGNNGYGILDDFNSLVPYSDAVEKETSTTVTKNMKTSPDLSTTVALYDSDGRQLTGIIPAGESFSVVAEVHNIAQGSFYSSFTFSYSVKDSSGRTIVSDSTNYGTSSLPTGYYWTFDDMDALELSAGDYTLTVSALPRNSSVSEAYRYNNTYTATLSVRDTYLSGDADGDDVISVTDVTAIQRTLAKLSTRASADLIRVRGDVTGDILDILDATAIQRYIADLDCYWRVGTTAVYDTDIL